MVQHSDIKVAIRVRPRPKNPQGYEESKRKSIIKNSGDNTITIRNPGNPKDRSFIFHKVFCNNNITIAEEQKQVYNTLGRGLLKNAFDGYNCSLFTYGQSGSGKSFSLYGTQQYPGIVPQLIKDIFKMIEIKKRERNKEQTRFKVVMSLFEINEKKVRDLLNVHNPDNAAGLKIREHPIHGPHCPSMSWVQVEDPLHLMELYESALIPPGKTAIPSSRSHTVLRICLTQTKVNISKKKNMATNIVSRINLIDLGAPERLSTNTELSKEDFKTGASINTTLSHLGLVIKLLASKTNKKSLNEEALALTAPSDSEDMLKLNKTTYIPYRDSVLTWLLKDSLGGNAKCMVLASLLPDSEHYQTSINTLRFSAQCAMIRNKVKINAHANDNFSNELDDEISSLEQKLAMMEAAGEFTEEYYKLKAQLEEAKNLKEVISVQDVKARQKIVAQQKEKSINHMLKQGVSILDIGRLMNINLNGVPYLLSTRYERHHEKMIYFLDEPKLVVGSNAKASQIVLDKLPRSRLCQFVIERDEYSLESDVYMEPLAPSPAKKKRKSRSRSSSTVSQQQQGPLLQLNGNVVEEKTRLNPCDQISIGAYCFRYHPGVYAEGNAEQALNMQKARAAYLEKRQSDIEERLKDLLPKENRLEQLNRDIVDQEQKHRKLAAMLLEKKRELNDLNDYIHEQKQFKRSLRSQPTPSTEPSPTKRIKWYKHWSSGCCWLWCFPVLGVMVARRKQSKKNAIKPSSQREDREVEMINTEKASHQSSDHRSEDAASPQMVDLPDYPIRSPSPLHVLTSTPSTTNGFLDITSSSLQ